MNATTEPSHLPSPASAAPLPYGLEEEIDLIEYLVAVFRNKYWILLFAALCAGAGYGLGKFMPNRYESFVHLALREPDAPGGVAPDDRRAPEVLTLMEHGFVMGSVNENYRHIIMARLRSRIFTNHFILSHDVLPHLFAEQWDADKQQWRDGFQPDMAQAYKTFHDDVRSVSHNPENDLMAVHIRWRDARVAADWANAYVRTFNDFMRQNAIEESRRKTEFLKEELRKTTTVEMQKSIYRMIEAETAIVMLASARQNHVLEVLDDAVPAARPFSPSLKRMLLFGFFAGFGIGIGTTIGGVLVRKIRHAMQAYRLRNAEQD
jgi:hypothetical protein